MPTPRGPSASVCDCEFVEPDLAASLADLAHTRVVSSLDLPVVPPPSGEGVIRRRAEVRSCSACKAVWWIVVETAVHVTYDRDGLAALSRSKNEYGRGLRCRDVYDAESLNAWYPRLAESGAQFSEALRLAGPRPSPADVGKLRAAHGVLCEIAALHRPAGSLLQESQLDWSPSEYVINELIGQMADLIRHLKTTPGDLAAATSLRSIQQRCAAARAADPIFPSRKIRLPELWTPDLAPVEAVQSQIQSVTNGARRQGVGSAPHRELTRLRAEIARAWDAFHARVTWPTPEVEFLFLLEHLRSLDPTVCRDDLEALVHPRSVCNRIKTLMRTSCLAMPRSVVVVEWMAKLLDVPASRPRPMRMGRPTGGRNG